MSGHFNYVQYLKMKTNFSPCSHPAPKTKILEVSEENTLLNFLFASLPQQSKTSVKSLLSHRQVAVNGRVTTQFDTLLQKGDKITIGFDKNHKPFYHSQLKIVYEDTSLLVVEKAAGLLSMATEHIREKTAYHILSNYVKQNDPHSRIFILHRLDRDTSGLMMFAKNQEVQEKLQNNWENAIIERKYIAVVEGNLPQNEGTIRSYIRENSAFFVHTSTKKEGKLSITRYKVIKRNLRYSLVQLELETGRKNQIRVHMQAQGCPITGDKKYGARYNPLNRLALHAFKLCFIHPLTGEKLNFETGIPSRFNFLVKNNESLN